MAQESISDFMEMAKEYARAEKELEVQAWVFVGIERKDDKGNVERVYSYDLPREIYNRRSWVIKWRAAKMQCRYPKDTVCTYVSFYDKRLGNDTKLTEDLRKLISAKAQVSKVQRKIDEYVAWRRANDIFFDEKTDEQLIRMFEKLHIKRTAVQAAEERMKVKIEKIKENKV